MIRFKNEDAPLSLVVRRFPFPERRRRQHSDGLRGIQDQQILIAGDNRGALAGARSREHDIIIITVATSRRLPSVLGTMRTSPQATEGRLAHWQC